MKGMRSRSADSVASPRIPSSEAAKLTASLYPYVSEDDWELNRANFLRQVRDRIDMDLESGDY